MRIPISSFGCSKCCTALRPRVLREPSSDARSIRATCGLPNLYSLKAIASVSIMTPRRHQSATRTVSPVGHVGRSSQPPAVGLYNSSAYRQAHVVNVADTVPRYDMKPACRAAVDMMGNQGRTAESCMLGEERARKDLEGLVKVSERGTNSMFCAHGQ